jgi:hypothetical protein
MMKEERRRVSVEFGCEMETERKMFLTVPCKTSTLTLP